MAILSWVNLGACAFLMVACVVLYVDSLGQRRTIAAMQRLINANMAELVVMRDAFSRLAPTLPLTPPPPMARTAANVAPSEARERQLPPGAVVAEPVDTEGDRAGLAPEEPAPDTDRQPPRAAPVDVARALGAEPGMVGLTLDESDAAQAPEPAPLARRTLRAEAPSEPPPAGVPVPTDDAEAVARWRRTLRRHPIMDEVTFRGTAPTRETLERLASLTPDELERVDALAALYKVSRATMMGIVLASGSAEASANDTPRIAPLTAEEFAAIDRMARERGVSREAMFTYLTGTDLVAGEVFRPGPTTPPAGPANDVPPASGRRKG